MYYVNYNDFYFNKTKSYELSRLIENSTPATLEDNLIRDAIEEGIDVDLSLSAERATLIYDIIKNYNMNKRESEQIQGGFCRNITVNKDSEHCLSDRGRLLLYVSYF